MNASPTVLIADDEPLMISALAREARRHGLSFISDATSEHVHELARMHRPAVIILDVNQRVDGRDLLARLKKDPETRDCVVVMLSGSDDQFTRRICLELGAFDYMTKPLDPTFMSRIARMAKDAMNAAARVASASSSAQPRNAAIAFA